MDDLQTALLAHFGGSGAVAAPDLDRMWGEWFDDTYAARRGRATFVRTLRYLDTGDAGDADLGFRLGGWEIDLGKTAVQAGLVSAFLGGVLAVMGVDHVPVQVLPAVVPLVFDVRRSRLSASQRYLLAELVLQDDVREHARSADELYDSLLPATRDEVSRVDFEDFLDSCRRAGVADHDGDTITLTTPDQARFRVTFH